MSAAFAPAGWRSPGAQEPEARSTIMKGMDPNRHIPISRPPKPGASPALTPDERDALEHRIHCQCGCTLDVFTCRTTDFTCQVAPAMHQDILGLVEGGYAASEILALFVQTYGEQALMEPVASGFNILAWAMPWLALGAAATVVTWRIRRWRAAPDIASPPAGVDATPDELARIEAAVRGEGRGA
jgi:cytochrome c-type biogenesis protein CcmH